MIYIPKGSCPKALIDYKKKPGANYDFDGDTTNAKEQWRNCLLEEQGYLCAYTMMQIKYGFTKENTRTVRLEHLERQNNTKRDLKHSNVVAVCHGNDGKEPKHQYADVRKKCSDLDRRLHPTNKDCEKYIKYQPDGKIYSEECVLDRQLSDWLDSRNILRHSVLNLNYQELLDARVGAYKAVKNKIIKSENKLSEIKKLIKSFQVKDSDGKLKPYCGYILYHLRKELHQQKKLKNE